MMSLAHTTSYLAKDFISALLKPDPAVRLTADQALKHPVRVVVDHVTSCTHLALAVAYNTSV